jgi:hypothetical protein
MPEIQLLDAPPFAQPESIHPEAWYAFEGMIDTVGRTAFRMPTSCDLYLKQHLADFPKERQLLSAAMQQNIPGTILEDSVNGAIEPVLARLTREFAAKQKCSPEEAKWAVEAWAVSVKRAPGYVGHLEVLNRKPVAEVPTVSPKEERAIMGVIAALGGVFGAMAGNGLPWLFLYISYFAVDKHFSNREANAKDAVTILALLILMASSSVGGGIGAMLGWWMGRGNERPWAAFAAAFGAAFGTGCIYSMLFGPNWFATIPMGFAAFGAAYTSAARGGYEPSV